LGLVLFVVCGHAQVTTIPIQLYTSNEEVSPGYNYIKYYQVTPCFTSCGGNKWATLSIALPSNPSWNSNDPVVAMELSICQFSFDDGCVFATNYVWSTSSTFSPQIQWDWTQNLDQTGSFYIRVTAPIATVQYSFQIQFEVDGAFMSGTYNFRAFESSAVSETTNFNRLGQNALLFSDTVNNAATKTYFVQFCTNDWPANCNKNAFSITTTVVADPSRPMSQFNLYSCPWTYGGCGLYMYEVADLTATGVAQVIVSNPNFNATEGIYFTVYGIGGEYDGINQYGMSIVLKRSDEQ